MAIKWGDTQKFIQAVDDMYDIGLSDKKQIVEWENNDDMNKTWGACKMFFKRYYKPKKRYSTEKPGRMGFESAANVADKSKIERNELKTYLDRLSNATWADK